MFTLVLPEINPSIINIGNFEIRWYSLAYILGIVLGWFVIKYLNSKEKVFNDKNFSDDFFMYAVLGIILGGRLGYVLFYNFAYYIKNPLQIFAIWQGGMSFHGGLIGSVISMNLICKKHKVNFWKFADLCAVVAPIGLFLGRIANFINMELYGRVTTSRFGVIFPNAGNLPRHPSQLYEAILEGLLLFIILFSLTKYTKISEKTGILSGLFLIGYSISRIFVEFFREADVQIGYILKRITMGQLLSVPILITGLYLVKKNKK